MAFIVDDRGEQYDQVFEYQYFAGLSATQRKRNVQSLHLAIRRQYPRVKILEASTKSDEEIGRKLSAFNLTLDGCIFESVYQSSKVFENGDNFEFIKEMTPHESRNYLKEHSNGMSLKSFRYKGKDYPLVPRSAFFTYLYISALLEHPELDEEIKKYDIFTDISFSPKKLGSCQAKVLAFYKAHILNKGMSKEEIKHYLENDLWNDDRVDIAYKN